MKRRIDDIFNEFSKIDETIEEIVPSYGSLILIEGYARDTNYLRPYILNPEKENIFKKLQHICENALKGQYHIIGPDEVENFPLFNLMQQIYIEHELSRFDFVRRQDSLNNVFYYIIQLNEDFTKKQFIRFIPGLTGMLSKFFIFNYAAFEYVDETNDNIRHLVMTINSMIRSKCVSQLKNNNNRSITNGGLLLGSPTTDALYNMLSNHFHYEQNR